MLIVILPHPTAAMEIATGLAALAMTVGVGGWFFCMNGAVIADDRRNAVRPAWRIWKNIDTQILSTALQNFVEKQGKTE